MYNTIYGKKTNRPWAEKQKENFFTQNEETACGKIRNACWTKEKTQKIKERKLGVIVGFL